jgi:polar amino acid transport system substrate-binding protein
MRRTVFWVCLALAAVSGSQSLAETLHLVTEQVPPVNMAGPNGEVTGLSTELVEMALGKAGIARTVSLMSWARAFDMARNDINTCVYSTSRTEEREPWFKWIGPIVKDQWVLFGRADGPLPASLEEARSHSIGGHYASAAGDFLKSQGFQIEEMADFQSNLRRVAAHRLDYWAGGLLGGQYAVAHDTELDGIVPVLAFRDVGLYLACNKSVSDKTVDKLNAILKTMADDGTVTAVKKHYR